jgi:hypothetical protein
MRQTAAIGRTCVPIFWISQSRSMHDHSLVTAPDRRAGRPRARGARVRQQAAAADWQCGRADESGRRHCPRLRRHVCTALSTRELFLVLRCAQEQSVGPCTAGAAHDRRSPAMRSGPSAWPPVRGHIHKLGPPGPTPARACHLSRRGAACLSQPPLCSCGAQLFAAHPYAITLLSHGGGAA